MLRTKEQRLVGGRSFGFSTLFYAIAFTVGHQPKNRLHIYIYISDRIASWHHENDCHRSILQN